MINSKYHTRHNYETLYEWILKQTGSKGGNPRTMHIQELLNSLNLLLRMNNAETLDLEEMDEITKSIILNQQS